MSRLGRIANSTRTWREDSSPVRQGKSYGASSFVEGFAPDKGKCITPWPSSCSPVFAPLNFSSVGRGSNFIPKPCAGRWKVPGLGSRTGTRNGSLSCIGFSPLNWRVIVSEKVTGLCSQTRFNGQSRNNGWSAGGGSTTKSTRARWSTYSWAPNISMQRPKGAPLIGVLLPRVDANYSRAGARTVRGMPRGLNDRGLRAGLSQLDDLRRR